jgi:hypothetical protein
MVFNATFSNISLISWRSVLLKIDNLIQNEVLSSSWSYGSCIYNNLCNQCLSPLKLYGRTPFMARCTRYNIIFYVLTTTYWFGNPPGPGLGQAQWCGGVKLVNRNLALSSDYWISNDNTEINEQSAPMYLNRYCRRHDRMVVVFTTTCAISAFHH